MRALAALVLLLSGCSIFFDPTKAKVGCSPERCPVRANAVARCQDGQCAYACSAGRTDPNRDLTASTSNGCEGCSPAAAPSALHALVGNPSGGVHWTWDSVPGDADAGTGTATGFTLCTGAMPASLGSCQTLDASVACTGAACGVLTMGHLNDARVYARVQAIDQCGVASGGPTQSTTPIDGTLLSVKPTNVNGDSPCDAGFFTDAGVLKIEQTGTCLSAITFGDDLWQDFSLTGQIQLDGPAAAGFAFHYPTATPKTRSSLLLTPTSNESEYGAAMTTIPMGQTADKIAASSIGPVAPLQWLDVAIVSKGGEVSAAVGPLGSPKPLMRWHESGTALKGRFGVYLLTVLAGQYESVQFRNVQISTDAVLPARGTTEVKPQFVGTTMPPEARVIPLTGAGPTVNSCFTGPEATGCAAGTCKPSGSSCLIINQTPGVRRSVTFDAPYGLDTKQPWRISFKFVAMTPNDTFAPILRTQSGAQVIRGPMGMWPGLVSVFGTVSDGTIEVLKWNRFDLKFTGSAYEVFLNGKKLAVGPAYPPMGWDAHLGAISFGGPEGPIPLFGQGNVNGQWADLEIVQPP